MIDRGISENYLVWWLENAEPGDSYDLARHLDRGLEAARCLRHAGRRSIADLYDGYLHTFQHPAIAAEALRRALQALAEVPQPILFERLPDEMFLQYLSLPRVAEPRPEARRSAAPRKTSAAIYGTPQS